MLNKLFSKITKPEAYRQRFRDLKKSDNKTFVEFVREKEIMFNRWCASRQVGVSFEKLKQIMLLEEFKRSLYSDIRTHLNERDVTELHEAAVKADDYAITHKASLN